MMGSFLEGKTPRSISMILVYRGFGVVVFEFAYVLVGLAFLFYFVVAGYRG